MNALTKKQIQTDETLARLVGVSEGTLVSYAELTKAVHDYIKRNKLRKEAAEVSMASVPVATPIKFCSACGTSIISSVSYCDECGEKQ